MGTDVDIPEPSQEEKRLQSQQAETLRFQREHLQRQSREQELLAPFLYETAGISPVYNVPDEEGVLPRPDLPEGEVIEFGREPETEADQLREQIELGFLRRTQAAQAGELPINPALTRQLEEGEEQIRERLLRQLGPGFETSTPGIETLDTFLRSKSDILEASRRGDLSMSEALGLAREQANIGRESDFLSRTFGVSGRGAGTMQQSATLSTGFGAAATGLQRNRALELQGNIASAQAKASTVGALFGAAGTGLGLYTSIAKKPFGIG